MIVDVIVFSVVFFFFQAEDGIRDLYVTGVQTCALPISMRQMVTSARRKLRFCAQRLRITIELRSSAPMPEPSPAGAMVSARSEERRVGKECRSRWAPYH